MGRRVEEEVGWGGSGVGGAARRQMRCGGKVGEKEWGGEEGRGRGGGQGWGRRIGVGEEWKRRGGAGEEGWGRRGGWLEEGKGGEKGRDFYFQHHVCDKKCATMDHEGPSISVIIYIDHQLTLSLMFTSISEVERRRSTQVV